MRVVASKGPRIQCVVSAERYHNDLPAQNGLLLWVDGRVDVGAEHLGPTRAHGHKDLTCWFRGLRQGRFQTFFVGSLCFCGLLGPCCRPLRQI